MQAPLQVTRFAGRCCAIERCPTAVSGIDQCRSRLATFARSEDGLRSMPSSRCLPGKRSLEAKGELGSCNRRGAKERKKKRIEVQVLPVGSPKRAIHTVTARSISKRKGVRYMYLICSLGPAASLTSSLEACLSPLFITSPSYPGPVSTYLYILFPRANQCSASAR